MFSFRLAERKTLLVVIDLIIVELTTVLAFWIMAFRAGWVFDLEYLVDQAGWFIFLPALWFFSALITGFYDPQKITDLSTAIGALVRAVAFVVIVYVVIYFFFATPGTLPRGIVGYQGVASFILIGLWRLAYVQVIQRPVFARKIIIVGAGWAGETIAQTIQDYASIHYRILGFIDDDPNKIGQCVRLEESKVDFPILGTARDLVRIVQEQNIPEVILAISHETRPLLFRALLECKERGIQVTLMSELFEQLTGRIPIEHIGDYWNIALPLDSAEASGFYPAAKRVFDITSASVGLVLYALIFPFIAIAIRVDSRGPIFYSQERVGKGGRVFQLLKLRTMVANAEADGQAVRAQERDPRITRVGGLLRKARLDEMPQLLNVLKGDMSAVGPRPERPEHLAELDRVIPFHRLRNSVKPGMAGWAVVNHGYVESVDDAKIRLQYDLYYIKHQSLWLDLIILLRTMGDMLALRGR
ncbi:MAG: sugar transferase [Chloroflexi bacterium]|nr:sugar transferase [Chloroflexota bacterium]